MIRNYLITILRNFQRNGTYTIINILGLSIGTTACVIIYLLVSYELDFDKFNSKYDRIYRVVTESTSPSGVDYDSSVPYPLTGAMRNDIPDVPLVTGMHYEDDVTVRIGTEKEKIANVIYADSLFFDVFDFNVISGNPSVELGEPNKVFLVKSLADRWMKDGERLVITIDNKVELEVAGVVADPPATSHIQFSMLVSYPSMKKELLNGLDINHWGMIASGFCYFVLPESVPLTNVADRIAGFTRKYRPQEEGKTTFRVQPMSDIHFSEQYDESPSALPPVNKGNLATMSILGVFILAIACINFVNLATALAVRKSKEIGIRKTLGAMRGSLNAYFLAETFLMIAVSMLISLGTCQWLLQWLNGFLEKSLSLNFSGDPRLWFFIIGLVILATFLSGLYPATILSGFNPVGVLKNKLAGHGHSGALVRKVLVIFQFTIAQILIIGTLVVADQMNYFLNKPLGFDKEAVINVSLPENKESSMQSLKTRLEQIPGVEKVSLSLGGPTSDNNFGTGSFLSELGAETEFPVMLKLADVNYKDVYGLQLVAGRWFTEAENRAASLEESKDRTYVYLVNESYVRHLGFSDPSEIVGKHITTGLNAIDAEVIGVIADFHMSSLHNAVEPIVLLPFSFFYYDAGVRVSENALPGVVKEMQAAFDAVYPESQFEYEFLDQYLANLYRNDERTFLLFQVFSGISIFIGCLGLYGLISFMANQKMKEVGIRKVLGASVVSITTLFGKEFVKLIGIAFLLAAPISFYFMRDWLSGFAYRTTIQWVDFLIALAATLVVAIFTVSYRSIKSATANPVEVLRTE